MSLTKLENFLDIFNNSTINKQMLYNYKNFDFDDESLFNIHLNFLLENCYNIIIKEEQKVRLNQKQFREQLLEKYNGKCIVSDEDCVHELEAAHIVPVAVDESYDIDNGLLLTKNLHSTMDKYLWAINPETLEIEIKKDQNVGQIKKYAGHKVNIVLNDDLKNNLVVHYNNFING